jgi:uncharacterized OB-fold protein
MSGAPTDLELRLRYAHGAGALQPYFDALVDGRALASRCPNCGRVWFPPHLHCPDDGGACGWVELEGQGQVVSATETHGRLPLADAVAEHVFVLVAMQGADNAAFGRLKPGPGGQDPVGRRVHLIGISEPPPHPAQAALFELLEED